MCLRVKFYPPDPAVLREEITRWDFTQVFHSFIVSCCFNDYRSQLLLYVHTDGVSAQFCYFYFLFLAVMWLFCSRYPQFKVRKSILILSDIRSCRSIFYITLCNMPLSCIICNILLRCRGQSTDVQSASQRRLSVSGNELKCAAHVVCT